MTKQIKALLIILILSLTPFIYFWVRDVPTLHIENSVDGCVPYNVVEDVERFSINLSWKTGKECVSYVEYSLIANDENGQIVKEEERFNLKEEHSVTIEDLKPGTDYYVRIISDGKVYGTNGSAILIRTKD